MTPTPGDDRQRIGWIVVDLVNELRDPDHVIDTLSRSPARVIDGAEVLRDHLALIRARLKEKS